MIKYFGLLIALLLLVTLFPAAVEAQTGFGTIKGSLVNQTVDSSSSVADQPVTLRIYKGAVETDTKNTLSDSNGEFGFEGLSTDPTFVYGIDINYQGADYYSDLIRFEEGENTETVQIEVYDTTNSDENISITMRHAIVSQENDSLVIREILFILNSSDRTFMGNEGNGEKSRTLKFSLPANATDVQITAGLSEQDVVRDGVDFYDTSPVTPAGREIRYSYRLPLESKQELSWVLNYDVSRFDLLLSDADMRITSDKLAQGDPLNIGGKVYGHYAAVNLVSGSTIKAQLSAAEDGKSGGFTWAWLLTIIPVIIVVGFVYTRIRKPKSAGVTLDGEPARNRLLMEIAELDDSFENGTIEEEEYQQVRTEKKQKLMEIIRSQGKEGGD